MRKLILLALPLLTLLACNKYTALTESAISSYNSTNFTEAFETLDNAIQTDEKAGKIVKPGAYLWAGKAAYKLEKTKIAITYLTKAYNEGIYDEESLMMLASYYKTIDNLSKEINVLELYKTKFPNGKLEDTMNEKLFLSYVNSENWELAYSMYDSLSSNHASTISAQEGMLHVCEALGKDDEANTFAQEIIKKEASNEAALFYLAQRYYWKAENKYKLEMDRYEKKKTRSQYKKLLAQLKLISADYRTSRDYFLKLYKTSPKKDYAKFLGNIYARLNDKSKSNYYKKKAM